MYIHELIYNTNVLTINIYLEYIHKFLVSRFKIQKP